MHQNKNMDYDSNMQLTFLFPRGQKNKSVGKPKQILLYIVFYLMSSRLSAEEGKA